MSEKRSFDLENEHLQQLTGKEDFDNHRNLLNTAIPFFICNPNITHLDHVIAIKYVLLLDNAGKYTKLNCIDFGYNLEILEKLMDQVHSHSLALSINQNSLIADLPDALIEKQLLVKAVSLN
jgi:hypothetical protein